MSEASQINADIVLTSALVRSLLPIREVITDTVPHSLISTLASAAGAEVSHILNLDLSKQYGFDYLSAAINAGIDCVFLGNDEATIEFSARVEAGFETLAEPSRTVRFMTPDELLSPRVNVSWLALAHLNVNLLEVTSQTVKRHRPLISGLMQLDTESSQLLYSWCKDHGYTAVDGTLNSVAPNFCGYCYLIPDENLLNNVKRLVGVNTPLSPVSSSLKVQAQRYWEELVNINDELASLTAEYLYTQQIEYSDNSLLIIPQSFNECRVFIPLHTKGYYQIQFSVLGGESISAGTVVRCFVNGRLRLSQMVTEDTSVSIPYYEHDTGGRVQLLIVADKGINVSALDDGVTCSKFRICWKDEPDE